MSTAAPQFYDTTPFNWDIDLSIDVGDDDDWLSDDGWNIKWSVDTDDDDGQNIKLPFDDGGSNIDWDLSDYVYKDMGALYDMPYSLCAFYCAELCLQTPYCTFSFVHLREMACFFALAKQNYTVSFE